MPLTLDQAAQLMNRNLEQFLHRCPLSISSAGQSKGALTFYLYSLGDTALGINQGVQMPEMRLRLSKTALSSSAKALQCIHIPVSQFEQLKPESISKVTHYDSANFLVTTQLTGCTFAIRPGKGGGLEFLHVQPNRDFDGAKIQQAIKKEFQVSFGKGNGSNGTTYGNNTRVTVLGERKNGLWKVYAQYQDGNGNVTGVDCIYKEPSSVAYVD
ncbi:MULTISPECIES: hypothetical protein [Vibrio]|uniref:Uncharacterized protein n=2 Tax=Vibrio TaxID=662 RepID=A0A2N7NL74_9VIBR|nr:MULTISPECIES: hypothetical protein [Vibrio]EAQ54588.1 hypothetical protein MED222_03855 [Vibrio sp. MED222]PMP16521.1 hypothetical protein BCS92_07690 [Vibrio tasmaniensis]TKG37662.1 hypothetical protein FC057_00015 [Vibrio tasmaniensis]TKG43824.1 hypothetical protein FC063_00015 [Vibrio tasmaniensis]TKG46073.1 hypothetical protein FC060_13280 [Vibrio tasmaniensis]